MIEALIAGVTNVFVPGVLLALFIGFIVSLIFGVIPGLGSMQAIAIVLPFTFGMNPIVALSLIVALQSCSVTGGSVTACLGGVPGVPSGACTMQDGFPMTKKGEGGRAVGAALCASGLGGLFGGVVLALLIPVAYPIIMAFGSGETGLIALVGLTFISVLTRGSAIRGLACAFVGMLLGLAGAQPLTGIARFNFATTYLYEGFSVIPVMLGLFAIPVVIELSMKGSGAIAEVDEASLKPPFAQVWQGICDVLRHWSLHLRW